MARGGYRAPTKPAPTSGPGKMSRRTDGGPGARQPMATLPNPAYGEQATYRQDQQGAPMAASPSPSGGPQMPSADLSQVTPFGAPTQRPNEPITAGAASGAGPGPEALGLGQGQDPSRQYLDGLLPMLELAANLPAAGLAFRQFVRRLRGSQQ